MLALFIRLVGVVLSIILVYGCSPNTTDNQATDSSAAKPAKTYSWKMVTTWPKNYPGLGTSPERFAQWVEQMSSGRLKIKVFGAGEIVPALEVFDSVSQGTAEMGHGASYYWRGKAPASAFFTSVPFGLTAQEMNGWLHYGGGLELWEELYAPFNLKPLAAGNTGVQMAGWFNREINSLDDLKGLKMRIPGIGGEILSRLGGTPVVIAGGELFTSLQTGNIDATEWVGPYNDVAFGLDKAAKYYYFPGWHEPGPTLELIINKKAFESLPEDLQMIVTVGARAANQDMLDEYTARNNAALEKLVKDESVDVRKLPDDVLVKLKEISEQVVAEIGQTDELSQRIYESYKSFKDNVSNYHNVSERAYINARD